MSQFKLKQLFGRVLFNLDPNATREGLRETPERVAKAWSFWCSGYDMDPAAVLKSFEDGAEGYDEMVTVTKIPVYSHCVVGATFIETPRGRVPIKHLRDGDWIYTMNPVTFEVAIVRCVNPRITQRDAALVQIHTDNDDLICTPDHKVLLTSGEWREAQHLRNGDRLASLYRGATEFMSQSGGVRYPVLMSSRWTRHDRGISLAGETRSWVEHRFVQRFFSGTSYDGRALVTHHKDETVWHNNPENLETITPAQHNREHQRTQKLAHSENRKRAAAASSGRLDVRAKRSASVKAAWARLKGDTAAYDERRAAMSEGIEKAGRNHVVFGVTRLASREDVWCMNVPDTKLFFANGIAVHNCEHHMAAIFGDATISYIPNGRVVGLSKMKRLVDVFARRLQVQERLTIQIADALHEHLQPKGVGVTLSCRHMCKESRGIQTPGSTTVTTALRGVMKTDAASRAEYLSLIK